MRKINTNSCERYCKPANLEKVVFQEIPEWLVGRNGPPGIVVQVQDRKQSHQNQGGQLRLVSQHDQHHQNGADDVLDNLPYAQLKADQSDKHEGQQDAARQLHEVLGLVFAHRWHAGKQTAPLYPGFRQDEQ